MANKNRLLWLPSVVGRVCVFLFFFTLATILLFLLGNFQSFLDSTQLFLLHLFDISCVVFVVACLYYIAVLISMAVRQKQVRVFRLVIAIAGAAVFASLYVVVRFLLAWL